MVDGVDELLEIYEEVRVSGSPAVASNGTGEIETSEEDTEMSNPAEGRRRGAQLPQNERTRARTLLGRSPRTPDHEPATRQPEVFFIVGRAKSGTTWLTRTLDAHPEVLCRGEGRLFGRNYVLPGAETPTIPARPLAGALASNEALRSWLDRSVWTREGDTEEQLAEATRVLTDHFLTRALEPTGKRIIGDKTPFLSSDIVAEIAAIHPRARVIHVIRDGRDVAISAKHHIWNRSTGAGGIHDLDERERDVRDAYRANRETFVGGGNSIFSAEWLAGTASEWVEMTRRAREDGRTLLGDRYFELRYEDMKSDPETCIRDAFEFLGADPDAEQVRVCVETASFERATKGRKPGEERPTEFLRKGITGEWREVFTESDRRVFKESAGAFLIELGYESDDAW